MQLVGTVAYGWQTDRLRFVGLEITVHDILELGKDVFVYIFTGDELAVIKTDAVIEQKLDVGDNQHFAVLVYSPVKLFADVVQAIDDDTPFLFGEMKGLVHLVGEERIVLHIVSEGCAADQVGVE